MSDDKRVFKFDEPAVGTDAEFFLVDAGGNAISSEGIVGGRKDHPVLCTGGGYLEDCVTVEINPDPVPVSDGADVFSNNIQQCIDEVTRVVSPLNLTVDITPAKLFQKDQLGTEQSQESGCSRTYDVWENKRIRPIDISISDVRFASGDIHLSWPLAEDHATLMLQRKTIAKYMDIVVGLSEVAHTELNERTSAGYGNPGIHRPTPYGVEYKTPSNFWLHSPAKRKWVFNTSIRVIQDVISRPESIASYVDRYKDSVQSIRARWARDDASEILSGFDSFNAFPRG